MKKYKYYMNIEAGNHSYSIFFYITYAQYVHCEQIYNYYILMKISLDHSSMLLILNAIPAKNPNQTSGKFKIN